MGVGAVKNKQFVPIFNIYGPEYRLNADEEEPFSMKFIKFLSFVVVLGFGILNAQEVPPLKIIYFVPTDCQPFENREERLGRVMTNIQEFYRRGMDANGYGSKTFQLEWDAPGKLKLYTVRGKKRQAEYGRNDGGIIRDEVRAALMERDGIEINEEVVLIFQVLLRWDGDQATELGPFVGGGGSLSGTAWVYDDPRLDAAKLSSKDPGGYYGGPCSIGRFNTHYIGGVAHELGHAFSLPHDCEKIDEKAKWGNSLMGSGNHSYGAELRSEGKGTFLSAASAMQLSTVRAFVGELPRARERAFWKVEELEATCRKEKIILVGRVTADPPLVGIIAYNDDSNVPDDYDAKTWTATPDAAGCFRFEIGEWKKSSYQLRLVGVHANGKTSRFVVDYLVGDKGPDLDPFNTAIPLAELKKFFLMGNRERIGEILDDLTTQFPNDKVLQRKAKHLRDLLKTTALYDLNEQPDGVRRIDLSLAEFAAADVGWANPRRGNVPEDVFLEVGGEFFESGLYAHAPASYQFDLGGRWKTLKSGYGLQDGHGGSIVFVVRGDGKELFRSERVADRKLRRLDVDVKNVKRLELIVEDAGNGNNSDWGLWIEPTLER